jgi:hypothetical protein
LTRRDRANARENECIKSDFFVFQFWHRGRHLEIKMKLEFAFGAKPETKRIHVTSLFDRRSRRSQLWYWSCWTAAVASAG